MAKLSRSNLNHIGIFAIIVAAFGLILAYALFSYSGLDNNTSYGEPMVVRPAPSPEADSRVAALEQQSNSDEISALEADLNATLLSDLDSDSTRVLNELQGL